MAGRGRPSAVAGGPAQGPIEGSDVADQLVGGLVGGEVPAAGYGLSDADGVERIDHDRFWAEPSDLFRRLGS